MAQRWIFHCDCNSFYASVELLRHPELKDRPTAVCGDPASRRGVILAKNEAAKAFGVQTAETVYSALRKCPGLHLLAPHHDEYRRFSRRVNAIYETYTDRVEPFGIDESWLDMTGTWQLFGESPAAVADRLRAQVKAETGLSISVGVSFNKVLAKIGSDYKKPDATTVIGPENWKEIVWPLPVGALLYAGASAQRALAALGVRNIGQLAAADDSVLRGALGKLGPQLGRYARGLDASPVRAAGEHPAVKSVGNGLTFARDLVSDTDMRIGTGALADQVAARLRAAGLYCTAVQVVLKDTRLRTISRQEQLPCPSHLAAEIGAAALGLIRRNWDGRPIRMITVTALGLTESPARQMSFWEDDALPARRKRERLEQSLDSIRRRFGRHAIGPAGVLHNDIGLASIELEQNRAGEGEGQTGYEEE